MKTLALGLLWAGGSASAIGVAWTGVRVVDQQIIDPAPAIVVTTTTEQGGVDGDSTVDTPTSTEARSTDPGSGTVSATGSSSITATTGAVGAPSTTATTGVQASSTTTRPSTSTTVGTTTSTTVRAVTSTTTRSTTSTTRSTTSTTRATTTTRPTTTTTRATTTTAAAPQTRTVRSVGGSASFSFTEDSVTVLWASPASGFDVDISDSGPGVRVEFESDDHRSRIEAWWSGGPATSVDED